jgi:hypothetical protein
MIGTRDSTIQYCKIIEVIETKFVAGTGETGDPFRMVTAYFTTDTGEFIADDDSVQPEREQK